MRMAPLSFLGAFAGFFAAFVQCSMKMKNKSTATGCAHKTLGKSSKIRAYLDLKSRTTKKDYLMKWLYFKMLKVQAKRAANLRRL
jgi:hypothetical protein